VIILCSKLDNSDDIKVPPSDVFKSKLDEVYGGKEFSVFPLVLANFGTNFFHFFFD